MECNFENCGYYTDGECTICGMGTDGEDTFCKYCKDNPNCYYKQLTEVKKYQYQQEYLDKEIENHQKLIWTLAEGLNIRQQTLQEIKGVVTALYMNNWLQMNETARKSIRLLQELITKAESEG